MSAKGGGFAVDAATFRAVSALAGEARAELAFTYLGPTSATRALGSGAVRRQIGLKLRAQDPCNLVYVMWRFEPEATIAVQTKRNPGLRTSAECGNRGYATIAPRTTAPLPPIAPGSRHVLRAEIDGDALRVSVDGAIAWEGSLGDAAIGIDGPVGVRSDNARFEGELTSLASSAPIPCRAAEERE